MITKYSTISSLSFFLLLFVPFLLYPPFIYIFSFTFSLTNELQRRPNNYYKGPT